MTRQEHNDIVVKFIFKVRGILPSQSEVDNCWDLVSDFAKEMNAIDYEKDVFEKWPEFNDFLTRRVKINQKARWN